MSTPFLRLLVTEPNLLIDHVDAYVELAGDEMGTAIAAYGHRVRLTVTMLCCLTSGATLAGVAIMLAAAMPELHAQTVWALIATPAPLFAVALWCLGALRLPQSAPLFEGLRCQLMNDRAMLNGKDAP